MNGYVTCGYCRFFILDSKANPKVFPPISGRCDMVGMPVHKNHSVCEKFKIIDGLHTTKKIPKF